MTFTFKQTDINGYHICVDQEKFSTAYHVRMYNGYGHTISDLIYATMEKANRRYNYLRRKASREV